MRCLAHGNQLGSQVPDLHPPPSARGPEQRDTQVKPAQVRPFAAAVEALILCQRLVAKTPFDVFLAGLRPPCF